MENYTAQPPGFQLRILQARNIKPLDDASIRSDVFQKLRQLSKRIVQLLSENTLVHVMFLSLFSRVAVWFVTRLLCVKDNEVLTKTLM